MDEIQKVLIAQGRKDLAQKYYEKISNKTAAVVDVNNTGDPFEERKKLVEFAEEISSKIRNTSPPDADSVRYEGARRRNYKTISPIRNCK